MATLRENALRIRDAKEEIRQSIINKSVDVEEDVKIEEYSLAIDSISTGPETGTYSIEVYIRVDNELIGEGVNFNVIGTDGTSTAATSRSGGYLFLTLNYNVGYDVQPAEEDKYFAESHILIYHTKNEGDYFATDYYFTTAGGSEEWAPITDWTNIFYQGSLIDNADKIIPHLDASPTGMVNFGYLKNSTKYEIGYEILKLLETTDFSKITNAQYAFNGIVIPKKDENIWEINCNIDFSKTTNMSYFLQRINYPNSHSLNEYAKIQKINLILDFGGTTNKVTNFTQAFSYLLINTMPILNILNLNMSACTNCSGTLNTLEGQSNLNRFTFSGSFGGSSSSSSLTLDLSDLDSLTVEAFLETMTTISENTNGKTRIFKLPAALYDSLTDEIFDLADEKGYTLSS